MTGSVQALGYVRGTATGDWNCISKGLPVSGHEFHYSRVLPDRDARFALILTRGKGIEKNLDGLVQGSATGTYTHAYFSEQFSREFVICCAGFRRYAP